MIPTLEITTYQFPYFLEVLATIAWATSGALMARAYGFDFMGVFIIALVSTTAGGLIRDGIFLQRVPVMLTNPLYLVLAFLATLVISMFGGFWEKFQKGDVVISAFDAIGTPAFALIGFQLAYLAGIPIAGALFVGLVNGVAGGITRDIFVGNVPSFFRPGQYFSLILVACLLLYIALVASQRVESNLAAWIAILFATVTRGLVIRYDWKSRAVNEWGIGQTISGLPTFFSRSPHLFKRRKSPSPQDLHDSKEKAE